MKFTILLLSLFFIKTISAQLLVASSQLEGNKTEAHYGCAVASDADVNGDGYADVFVGARDFKNGERSEGRVYVYLGSSTGLNTTPQAIFEPNVEYAYFGESLASAGDVNGDGYDELIVGALQLSGSIYIYYGTSSGVSLTPQIIYGSVFTPSDNGFGGEVNGAGDVNGDGYDDIMVGMEYYENGQTNEGGVCIYYGSAIGIDSANYTVMELNIASSGMGKSLSSAGDVNNDGYDDVIIGANLIDDPLLDAGKAFIFHGSAAGISSTPTTVLEIDQQYAFFGENVCGLGDVNNDGYDDVAVSTTQYETDEGFDGLVRVYLGSASGINPIPIASFVSEVENGLFGCSIAGAGDLDQDGYDDLIVGAKWYANPEEREGVVFVYLGNAVGIYSEPYITLERNTSWSYFGSALSGNGDINGDSFPDLLIGADYYDHPQLDEGGAFVYLAQACTNTFYLDNDNDGFGDISSPAIACMPPINYVADATDCNDLNANIFPGHQEICNSLDDDCNGLIDESVVETISISAGGTTTFCQGGSVLLSATYSGPAIQWKKNGANIAGATSSTYSVTKTGNYSAVTTSPCGTATSSTISVTVNKNPNASISAGGATSFCAGGSVTLTEIPVAGCTYKWYKDGSIIAGANTTNYIATTAGIYKCRVTKTATGCYKNSNAISVTVPCKEGDEIINEGKIFSIYPNPNNGTFEIAVNYLASATSPLERGRGVSIEIYNSLGQLIYSNEIISSSQTISLDNISSGIYFVRVGVGNNYAEQKLIIDK